MYPGERFNSISHLVGCIAALGGLIGLMYVAIVKGDPAKIVSFSFYGTTLVFLYLSSTLFHAIPHGEAKRFFQKLDHVAIYLLIAGSYMPFTLVTLDLTWGIPLLSVVWALAIAGIMLDLFSERRRFAIGIYLLMGWLVLVAIYPLYQALPAGGMVLLVCGGVFYTAGLFFYIKEDVIKHGHGIWHLFVLAGSASHFGAVAAYIA